MKKLCMLIIIFSAAVPYTYAQQTSFQISAPPIPWYEFCEGQMDLKLNGTYLYLSGTIDDPEAGGDVEVSGGGGSAFYRYAAGNKLALDMGALFLGAYGYVGPDATLAMNIYSVPFDLEFQPVNSENYSLIFFLGYNFTWLNLGVEADDGYDKASAYIWSTVRGPQFGVQLAIKYTEFVFTPFFMATRMSGDADVDIEYNGDSMSVTSSIPASTSFYYGIDIIYVPWNLTLSSILQQAMESGENQDYRTYVFTVSYHFQLADGVKTIDIPPVEKEAGNRPGKKQLNKNSQTQQ